MNRQKSKRYLTVKPGLIRKKLKAHSHIPLDVSEEMFFKMTNFVFAVPDVAEK